MSGERDIILVDEQDQVVGFGEKMEVHRKGLLHRAFSIFIYDRENDRMLLQQRAPGKYHSGGLWTNACCSHPRKGMTMEACLNRRLGEELGLRTDLPIAAAARDGFRPCGRFLYEMRQGDTGEHEMDHVFLYCPAETIDIDALDFDRSEIGALKWAGREELHAWLEERPEDFTAWFAPALALAERAIEQEKGA